MSTQKPTAWDPSGTFRQVSPHRLELKRGGGCLSLFGLPFMAAGIFQLLAAVRIIPMSNAAQQPWWTWLILFGMGLVFTAVGSTLVFGRHWVDIDRSHRRIWLGWGLLRPLKGSSYDLDMYRKLLIRMEAGDSDTAASYLIYLVSESSGNEIKIFGSIDYGVTRAQAEMLMDFLRISLEDRSTLTPKEFNTPQAAQSELHSILSQSTAPLTMPPNLRSQISQSGDTITIGIPDLLSRMAVWAAMIPLFFILLFGGRMLLFLLRSHTPWQVKLLFFGFAGLIGLLPMLGFWGRFLNQNKPQYTVQISPRGIVIQPRKGRAQNIPLESIIGIDCGTRAAILEQIAAQSEHLSYGKTGNYGAAIPPWLAKMSKYRRADGVVIKSQSGIHYFGTGLDDAEVEYLFELTKRGMRGD